MTHDPEAPKKLIETQEWFASIITQPIDEKSHINPLSPSGRKIADEACDYIIPSPTLKPDQRIELYNQQYWWRLINTLQISFPTAVSLLGYRDFNYSIAIPYLVKYPSRHWSLSFLGDRLHQWMQEEYRGEEKELLTDAIRIDWTYDYSFFAPHRPSITSQVTSPEDELPQVISVKACLQPHLFLFKLDYDLFSFRDKLKQKSPDYWSNHHFPNLKHALSEGQTHFPELKRDRIYYFVLYRNLQNSVAHEEISQGEYQLLERFKESSSIEEACQWLESQEGELYQDAAAHLQDWTKKWVIKQWLTPN